KPCVPTALTPTCQLGEEGRLDWYLLSEAGTMGCVPNRKGRCATTTKTGYPCPNNAANRSGLCHIHDPALQCGALVGPGSRKCAVATGGGRCRDHFVPDQDALF